jgi:preprotein translocase subunit SecA
MSNYKAVGIAEEIEIPKFNVARSYLGMYAAMAMMMNESIPMYDFNDGSPSLKTHGSNAVKLISVEEWKDKKKEQGRNEPCACGSGKKYKKCCALLPVINEEN